MSEQSGGDPAPKRMVYETRQDAKEIRQLCRRQMLYGGLSDDLHLQLVETVLEYNQTLREFDGEGVVEERDYPDLTKLKQAVGKQSSRIVTTGGQWGDSSRIERQPAALDFSPTQLLAVLNRLDQLARKLGFSAETTNHTPVFGVDPEWEGGDDDGGSTAE